MRLDRSSPIYLSHPKKPWGRFLLNLWKVRDLEGNTSFAIEDQKLMLVSSLERLSHGQELNIRMRVQDAGGWNDEVSMTILVISGRGS